MRVVITIFCVALIAGAYAREKASYSSRITFPDFLRYFPKYLRQYFSPSQQYSSSEEEEWGYEQENGPSTWGRTFPTCNGQRQSPIALSVRSAEMSNFGLDLRGYDVRVSANVTNTGHTVVVMFNYEGQQPPRVKFLDGNVSHTFTFASLHFHWPRSEHTIDGRRYDMEMHLVHTRDPSDTTPGDSLLVLGYVYWVRGTSRPGVEVVADALPFVRDVNDSVRLFTPISPADFMPDARGDAECKFFTYPGSLTTPPCTESVTWLVKKTPLSVTRSQLYRFENLVQTSDHQTLDDNYRPLQPINDRTVKYKACHYN